MKVVTRDVQDLYERKVVEEFRWALRKGLSIDNSYVEGIVMARGISYGVHVLVLSMILINVSKH